MVFFLFYPSAAAVAGAHLKVFIQHKELFKEISADNVRNHKVTTYQDLIDEMNAVK